MRRSVTTVLLTFALSNAALAQSAPAQPPAGGPDTEAGAQSETTPAQTPSEGSEPEAEPAPPREPTEQEREAARQAYGEGQALFGEEDFEGAAAAFQRAFEAVPNPIVLKPLAECQIKLGRLREAVDSFEQYLKGTPEAEDREAIEARIADLKATPAILVITSNPPGAKVTLDGQDTGKVTPAEFSVAGGEHKLGLSLAGHQEIEDTVEPAFGARHEVEVQLTELPPPPPVVAAEPEPVVEQPPLEPPTTVLWLTGIVGAAGLVTGSVLGFMALSEKSDFDAKPTAESADDGERLALFADMAFGVGAMAIITGTVLYFTWDDVPEASEEQSAVSVTPVITPRAAALTTQVRF